MASPFPDRGTLSKAEIESGSVFAPKFDADGLVLAIAVDAEARDVLMVAYMNADALALTLETGFAHYYSRSRRTLWKKGESSGEVQEVVEIRTDCDQDALVLHVRQKGHGAACHTGRRSCFYRRVVREDGTATLIDAGEPRLFDPEKVYGRSD